MTEHDEVRMDWHKWSDGTWKDHPEAAANATAGGGADPRSTDVKSPGEALYLAAQAGDAYEVVQLLAQSADVKYTAGNRQDTALHQACLLAAGENFVQIGELLISHGADIDAKDTEGYTPLMACAWSFGKDHMVAHKTALMKILLDHGADREWVDRDGDDVITHARCNGFDMMVQLLLQK